jgi:putative ABC transport system substrate-binding protein
MVVGDALEQGLVTSLVRPGGNITGFTQGSPDLSGKRLELLKEAVPRLSRVAVLWCPDLAGNPQQWRATQVAAQRLGVQLQSLKVHGAADLEAALAAASRDGADAMVVFDCAFFFSRVAALARKLPLPTMNGSPIYVRAGGLMSYSADTPELFRRVAVRLDKLLKGAKPGDLPVERPTKFELVINLKTAPALGLTIPPTLLFQAEEVIR